MLLASSRPRLGPTTRGSASRHGRDTRPRGSANQRDDGPPGRPGRPSVEPVQAARRKVGGRRSRGGDDALPSRRVARICHGPAGPRPAAGPPLTTSSVRPQASDAIQTDSETASSRARSNEQTQTAPSRDCRHSRRSRRIPCAARGRRSPQWSDGIQSGSLPRSVTSAANGPNQAPGIPHPACALECGSKPTTGRRSEAPRLVP